nr:helix-turn-helix transcriptional regulator [uncultured Acetatifactor sp.]
MNIADRIQQLRKSKGISQEELANSIGVSRQAVSKWESAQSVPDIEKIILLSDYFETTTDFLLKGIAPALVPEKRYSAMMFALIGTVLNAIGLVSSIVIWIEQQRAYAVGLGFAVMLIGTGIFLMGQFLDTRDKQKAKRFFLLPGVWILLFVPMSFCFNTLMGLKGGGFSWWIAPVPMPMHSYKTFGLYWIIYIAVCTAIDILIARQNRSAP